MTMKPKNAKATQTSDTIAMSSTTDETKPEAPSVPPRGASALASAGEEKPSQSEVPATVADDAAAISLRRNEGEQNRGKRLYLAHATQSRNVDFYGLKAALLSDTLDPLFWPAERQDSRTAAWNGHIPFAHWLVHAAQPGAIVELGTHAGVSYSAFCEAVIRAKAGTRCFAVDTWKGDEQAGFYDESVYADFKQFHDVHYAGFSKLMRMTFDEAVSAFDDGSIDLLHIDGLHTYDAVSHDFATWLPKLSAEGIVLFHDTNEYQADFGVWRLWAELRSRYPSFEFLHSHGLGVLCVGDLPPAPVLALCQSLDAAETATIRTRFQHLGERWAADSRSRTQFHDAAAKARDLREEAAAALSAARSEADADKAAALATARSRAEDEKAAALAAALKIAELERNTAVAAARKAEALNADKERLQILSEREQSKRAADAELAAANEELERLRAAEAAIASSVAWRITAPIRGIRAAQQRLRSRLGRRQDYQLVKGSGLFDQAWYLATYPDVAEGGN